MCRLFAYCTAMPNLGLTRAGTSYYARPCRVPQRVFFPYSSHSRGRKSKVIDKADIQIIIVKDDGTDNSPASTFSK